MSKVPNQLHPQLLGISGVNPFARSDAAARQQMVASHVSQSLVIEDASPRRHQSGFERELGTTTFAVTMPVDAEILAKIEKFPRSLAGRTSESPLTVVLYEDVNTKEIGVLEIPTYHCLHQHFGFRYKRNNNISLNRGDLVRAGTVIADTPSKDTTGNDNLGTEMEVVFLSVPGVIEDGVIISRSAARRMGVMGYEKRDVSFGQDHYPLNLYGSLNDYKIVPDVGEYIHDTGLLAGLRRFNENMDVIGMAPKNLMKPVHNFDRLRYGEPNARVVDINVIYEPKGNVKLTPVGMDDQVKYYYEQELKFNKALLQAYDDLKKIRRDTLRISRRLHTMIVQAKQYTSDKPRGTIKRMYQHQALDEWRLEVTYEYLATPDVPFKLTDFHGGKGVIVAVWEDDWMPVDAEGNRADIIMDADSTIKRMNVGRMYEQYNNAASRSVTNAVRAMFGVASEALFNDGRRGRLKSAEGQVVLAAAEKQMRQVLTEIAAGKHADKVKAAWEYLLGYYKITSPWQYDEMIKLEVTGPKQHVASVILSGVYLFFPTDNPVYYPQMVKDIEAQYPPHTGSVTYRPDGGDPVTTVHPALVGSLYIMLLEKTGGDHSGVSSAKTQHFGIPACLTKFDKHASAARSNPVRIAGESEIRLLAATIGGEKAAELLDLSNSPATHKAVVRKILTAAMPTNIPVIVDRQETPMGGNRALGLANHMLECAGIRFMVPELDRMQPEIYRDIMAEEDVDEGLDKAAAADVEEDIETPAKAAGGKPATEEDEEVESDEVEEADED